MTYTDRDGNDITAERWAELTRDPSYCVVAQAAGMDRVGAEATVWVIWTGLAPTPFEVRVFTGGQPHSTRATAAASPDVLAETIRDLGITR